MPLGLFTGPQLVVLTVVGIGAVFSMVFHLFVPDPSRRTSAAEDGDEAGMDVPNSAASDISAYTVERAFHLHWKEWFMESQFYIVSINFLSDI